MAFIDNPRAFVCTPSSLLDSSPCLKCVSEHDMLAVLVAIFANVADKTVNEVLEEGACFKCMSDKEMAQALITIMGSYLLGDDEGAVAEVVEQYHCLTCVPDKELKGAFLHLLCDFLNTYEYRPQT